MNKKEEARLPVNKKTPSRGEDVVNVLLGLGEEGDQALEFLIPQRELFVLKLCGKKWLDNRFLRAT